MCVDTFLFVKDMATHHTPRRQVCGCAKTKVSTLFSLSAQTLATYMLTSTVMQFNAPAHKQQSVDHAHVL